MTWRSNLRTLVVISIFLMAFLSSSSAKVIYVDADGSADFNNIQAAINDANNGDMVEIQPGTYRGIGNRDIDFLGKMITIRSTDPNNTNIVAETVIDCNGTQLDKHRGFHFHNSEDNNSVLEGLTIKNGYAWDEFDGNDVVEDGGGILVENSSPTIRNCIISNNLAEYNGAVGILGGFGGGICCYNNGNAIISNCIIISNIADIGGAGIACCESSPTIHNCIFSAGLSYGGGGGIYCGNNSNPLITNCTIVDNYTLDYGSGIWCFSNSNPSILDCAIKGNSAGNGSYGNGLGGGIACTESAPTISNCVITGNYASVSGGGIHCDADTNPSNPLIINCIIANNHAGDKGGGIRCHFSDPIITNSIVWGNTADSLGPQIALLLNPLWPSTLTVQYCDIQGGQNDAYVADGCSLQWLTGNIDVDPCFTEPGYWIFDYNIPDYLNNRFWIEGDYHLKSQAGRWDANSESWVMDYVSSPCIDSGNPGCPVGDELAPNGNRKNMGAYGGTAEAGKSPGNGRNIADLTNDWAIDYNDLKVFVDYWLEMGDCIPGDFDRSQFVDFNDYGIFASQWSHKQDSVAIFIDSNTHSNLTSRIQRLKSDIINDLGVNVFIFSDNWDDIREIKDILIDKYNNEGLIGAILIGDIPTAYFEYQNSGSVPTDRYFQDLSDKFIDVDGDGKFEREYYMAETDVTMREIWTGRIKPPVGRSEGVELLRDYLDRNHNYRTANLSYDKKMLYYGSISINQGGMSQDDYNDLVNQIDDYTGLYESDDEVDSIYDPNLEMQKRIYLTELKNSYDFVFVNIHGTVWHQWLGENSPGDQCVVYYNEIKEFRPQSLFSVLASCSNGDFTTENYFAGWFLFSGNSLVVQSNTTVSYLTGASTVEFLEDYIPLGLGVTFGDMDKNDRNFIVSHILGDPTLTLRPKPTGDLPSLSRYESEIDFGDTERGTIPRQYISFWNGGTATLKISYKKARISINGEYANLGYWDVFYYEPSTTGETFRDFEVRPGKCKVVPFYFYPRADGPIGRYTMTILFQTNDPENPYMEIHLSGNAI